MGGAVGRMCRATKSQEEPVSKLEAQLIAAVVKAKRAKKEHDGKNKPSFNGECRGREHAGHPGKPATAQRLSEAAPELVVDGASRAELWVVQPLSCSAVFSLFSGMAASRLALQGHAVAKAPCSVCEWARAHDFPPGDGAERPHPARQQHES